MACFVMSEINAQIVNSVNAYTANVVLQTRDVAKRVESEPSEFWKRLTEAWEKKGLATSQNGVATKLSMSQGSTHRWYTGEGYPEIEVLRTIAKLGNVTIDWLLLDTFPRSPVGKGTELGKFLTLWEQLDAPGREHVYQAALGQLAARRPNITHLAPPVPLHKVPSDNSDAEIIERRVSARRKKS